MGVKKYQVGYIVDSAIGLYGKDIEDNHTKQVFFNITDKFNTEYDDNNLVLTAQKILTEYENGNSFKTSAVSPGKVILALEELLETHDKVILFTVSSGLSSFNANVKYLVDEYKNKLYIVDTKEVGYAFQTMFFKAKTKIEQGEDFFEVLKFCNEYYLYNFTSFTCENWSPLVNSGRVPNTLSKFLNALKTRPIINFDVKNKLGGIVRSFESAVDKILKQFHKYFGDDIFNNPEYVVFYNNKIEKSKAEYIRNKIKNTFKISKDKILEMFVPNLVLVYTANGSFGIHARGFKKIDKED